ncbi:thioesterase family protein [Tahibacter sp.]|uniref:acyl-CoA thioesterase n=1 Tax=Tahibacter sp. TaxID=2056211 RepID=UPI0028C48307|nr:thioesterase family protein [Tahibacter sp.]
MTASDRAPAAADASAAALKQLARVPIRVRWRDLDAFNHVNNASFLTFLEEARLVWLSGIDGEWTGEAFMPVLAATQLNYRRQLGWPGEVMVELSVQRIGNSSLTIAHRIVSADDADLLYGDGSVVVVWADPASGASVALPAAVRRACEQPV